MEENKKNENSKISEQKNEKRKRKKRRGKSSNTEPQNTENNVSSSNPQQETPLLTVSSIISNPNLDNKLPINPEISESNNKEKENKEEESESKKKKRKRKSKGETKEKEDKTESQVQSGPLETVKEKITYKENNIKKDLNNENGEIKEEIIVIKEENNSNNILKSKNIILKNDINNKKENKDIKSDIIPSVNINPNELFEVDEDNGEIDYLEAQKAYDLSVFLGSHKFIRKNKNLDKKFIDLVKRKIIRFEKNIYDLIENDKFFILYELQLNENTNLSLTDIVTLNVIKSIFNSFPSIHLIIQISDEELSNKNPNKYDDTQIKNFSDEKLSKILIYLNINLDENNRVHAFSTQHFKEINTEFENEKIKLKEMVDKFRIRKLFNIKEENDLLLDYPCYLAVAANPSIYSQFIPEINSEYKCLIINSIFYMNRYHLCSDAAKILSFNEPSYIALKIVPPLKGVNGKESNFELEEEDIILSSDDNDSLKKKIFEVANEGEGEEGKDVAFQYLGFLEEDNNIYDDMKKKFGEEESNSQDIKKRVFELINELFKVVKEKENDSIDLNKIMIK